MYTLSPPAHQVVDALRRRDTDADAAERLRLTYQGPAPAVWRSAITSLRSGSSS